MKILFVLCSSVLLEHMAHTLSIEVNMHMLEKSQPIMYKNLHLMEHTDTIAED
jgi:hypothetical protein